MIILQSIRLSHLVCVCMCTRTYIQACECGTHMPYCSICVPQEVWRLGSWCQSSPSPSFETGFLLFCFQWIPQAADPGMGFWESSSASYLSYRSTGLADTYTKCPAFSWALDIQTQNSYTHDKLFHSPVHFLSPNLQNICCAWFKSEMLCWTYTWKHRGAININVWDLGSLSEIEMQNWRSSSYA